ncbi:hypothetical protein [Burkholderia pseudomultivorans]|uniref:hypothetical protein n=1 Tax=Burkholderia pseudomultivorans TaxID=1207504 RepID=UPI0035BE7216
MKRHLVIDVVYADSSPFLTAHIHGLSVRMLCAKAVIRVNFLDEIGHFIGIVAMKTVRLGPRFANHDGRSGLSGFDCIPMGINRAGSGAIHGRHRKEARAVR